MVKEPVGKSRASGPKHDKDMRFEAVVANPPFSAHWNANVVIESDDRFSQYGRLAPKSKSKSKSKADFAFVQHMIHHLAENGTMAVILPHGVLFRGGAEGHIREYLINDRNYLDAVIGLPANIFLWHFYSHLHSSVQKMP